MSGGGLWRDNYTLKPRLRRHLLCASMRSIQFCCPNLMTHVSLASRVSGHAQQIRNGAPLMLVGEEEVLLEGEEDGAAGSAAQAVLFLSEQAVLLLAIPSLMRRLAVCAHGRASARGSRMHAWDAKAGAAD